MSRTLNLVRGLLARGDELWRRGLEPQAEHLLARLAGLRDLPPDVAAQVHTRLGQLALNRRQFAKARRHLAIALSHEPTSAELHFLMASATNGDRQRGPKAATTFFRRSLRLEPNQPRCQAEYGLVALRLKRTKDGLASLRRALELDPDDVELVTKVVNGLRRHRQSAEANAVARAALFRNWRNPRFRRLWDRLRFHEARAVQQRVRRPRSRPQQTSARSVLPFLASASGS